MIQNTAGTGQGPILVAIFAQAHFGSSCDNMDPRRVSIIARGFAEQFDEYELTEALARLALMSTRDAGEALDLVHETIAAARASVNRGTPAAASSDVNTGPSAAAGSDVNHSPSAAAGSDVNHSPAAAGSDVNHGPPSHMVSPTRLSPGDTRVSSLGVAEQIGPDDAEWMIREAHEERARELEQECLEAKRSFLECALRHGK